MGKKLIKECLEYDVDVVVVAIVDNNAAEDTYMGAPVIKPQALSEYIYDEIWICTVYFEDIMNQLMNEYGVEQEKMRFTEPVIPILENRLLEKYKSQLNNLDAVSEELKVVLSYLKHNPLRMYCYSFYDEYLRKKSELWHDEKKGLYYGKYDGKRMYLARRFNTYQKARAYFNAVIMEQDSRSPHCYWNDEQLCRASGVGVDVGAAEGIFALKIIEQIQHIYLIEADEEWVEALQYTFESYKDKVSIIKKFAGDADCEKCAKLDTILDAPKIDFLKMDIEGMELEALRGAEKIILNNKMELAVCVYHHQKDNVLISEWLEIRGYHISNSNGLVVCQGDWELENDETDFRKALLFANNN